MNLIGILFLISFGKLAQGHTQAACSNIRSYQRIDCHPQDGASEQNCLNQGCCWIPLIPDEPGSPACYFPTNYSAYIVKSVDPTPRGFVAHLSKNQGSPVPNGYSEVRFEYRQETSARLRLRFTIPSEPNRWEPPLPLDGPEDISPQPFVELSKSPFGIRVMRNNITRDPLIECSELLSPSLIMSDQFLQISFRLFAHVGFGLGEHRTPFPLPLNEWRRMGFWTRDSPPIKDANLYGVHNLFMGMTYEGTAFGIFLLNSNAQEVALTPLPAITYRTLGGILDFFILMGPKPIDVIRQYYRLIGHPPVPPYWSLGFHLCRYGYSSLKEVQETLNRNRAKGIPVEIQWFDIDYMDKYKIWSIDPVNFANLGKFIRDTLHKEYGMKAVIMLDPAVSTEGGPDYQPYVSGLKMGLFINDSRTGKPIRGRVWPGETVFPDFSHPNAEQWIYELASAFHRDVPFDGLWIDMNEPASFVDGSTTACEQSDKLDNPPFVPNILDHSLHAKTICPSSQHYNTTHYNLHNMYGYFQAKATRGALKRLFPGTRPFLLSRSTFSGSGRYTIHWTGDNLASWSDLKASIAQLINFNMFGIPMIGADICGFRGNTSEELCIRWTQLGAFYPFSRNHNEVNSRVQDPAVWSDTAVEVMQNVLRLRYLLLPYWYSLFFRAHLFGEPVIRALAFEFPEDLSTHNVDSQFLVGSCLLVIPVLEAGRSEVDGYVPAGEWINLAGGTRFSSSGKRMHFLAPIQVINVLVRAGCILALQSSEITSVARTEGFRLFIVLSMVDDGSDFAGLHTHAEGELFWDDGQSDPLNYIHARFTVANRTLSLESTVPDNLKLDTEETAIHTVLINGFKVKPDRVTLNENNATFTFESRLQTLRVVCDKSCHITQKLILQWFFY